MKIKNNKLICSVIKDSETGEPMEFDISNISIEELRQIERSAIETARSQKEAFKNWENK